MSAPAASRGVPRALAIRVLTRVLSDQEPLDEALDRISREAGIATSERAWLQDVCAGSLRWKGRLDQLIDSVALKKKPTGWLRKVLLVAAYQLVAQDRALPASVVFETVAEVKKLEGEAPARFANAVLRKIGVHAQSYRSLPLDPAASEPEAASWASLPEWLWKRLVRQQGRDWAVSYAQACLERPAIWVRLRSDRTAPEWLGEPGPVPGSYRVAQAGNLAEKPGFREGSFFVQDISSQLLVEEISRETRAVLQGQGAGRVRALDLCAAPGGKSAGLAWNGFEVFSADLSEARYALLRDTLERVAREEVQLLPRAELSRLPPVDLAWVDAPCTGTGIVRRHPDVRWLRKEKDLQELTRIQQELLGEAWAKLRPGGVLAYSVCSVLNEEGPEAIDRFLASVGNATLRRSWFLTPFEGNRGDGFWAAIVSKA